MGSASILVIRTFSDWKCLHHTFCTQIRINKRPAAVLVLASLLAWVLEASSEPLTTSRAIVWYLISLAFLPVCAFHPPVGQASVVNTLFVHQFRMEAVERILLCMPECRVSPVLARMNQSMRGCAKIGNFLRVKIQAFWLLGNILRCSKAVLIGIRSKTLPIFSHKFMYCIVFLNVSFSIFRWSAMASPGHARRWRIANPSLPAIRFIDHAHNGL